MVRLLLQLRLELLVLLLEDVHAAEAEAHHVRRHHVGEHVGEAERRHLVVMTASSGTELLQTLELCLCLRKVRGVGCILQATDTAVDTPG